MGSYMNIRRPVRPRTLEMYLLHPDWSANLWWR
jgi:hypothetical protein